MNDTKYLVTFIFEGIVLITVALIGITGNIAAFITILKQKVQRTFHSLLFLLSVFDMVSKKTIIIYDSFDLVLSFSVHYVLLIINYKLENDYSK